LQEYAFYMKNYKNYVIALLTGLLVLSLSTQQAQSAGTSKEAKIVQYDHCLTNVALKNPTGLHNIEGEIPLCASYKP
jgi:hypothetical protein